MATSHRAKDKEAGGIRAPKFGPCNVTVDLLVTIELTLLFIYFI